ncbi:MAG TPA: CCA tRNA nucleotidyltransferase [Rhodobacteraceae bacterium]|jgi:poly(A) polymerase|nr:CCA tRNA nucleotidyltransferase [Paracoccaceae bacterium]HBG99427.1 CCA tRNA nucleotidyltransferase [Paracoccaceae bacterium]
MTRVAGDWLDRPATQAVLALLVDAGHRALAVGGCVRNALLGMPVADIDIATDARPERVTALARGAGLRAVPTGIDHGTVTLVVEGGAYEVTTFRRDVATDGRRATVAYSDDPAEDAARRDFTMNALYADARGTLFDPLGGLPDLRARRIRFIGDPGDRIREDYLRILRFFRFYAWYADPAAGPDAEGLAACAAMAPGIEGLARERIGAEMRKLLSAPDPAPAVASMRAAGVLARALPGATDAALAPLVHLERAADAAPDPIRRLAVLGGDRPKRDLRLSRAEAKRLALLRGAAGDTAGPGELGYRLGAEAARDVLLIRAAGSGTPLAAGDLAAAAAAARAVFPIAARDLADRHRGAALGAALKRLEADWIASGFALDRAALLARA